MEHLIPDFWKSIKCDVFFTKNCAQVVISGAIKLFLSFHLERVDCFILKGCINLCRGLSPFKAFQFLWHMVTLIFPLDILCYNWAEHETYKFHISVKSNSLEDDVNYLRRYFIGSTQFPSLRKQIIQLILET